MSHFFYPSIVPVRRIVELIKGYVADNSDGISRPDMNSEMHLLALSKLMIDEARARYVLWQLECADIDKKNRGES
jgi:hypothetical protein